MDEQRREWVMLSEGARLVDVPPGKITQLIKKGEISTRRDPRDGRVRLVDVVELRRMFPDVRGGKI